MEMNPEKYDQLDDVRGDTGADTSAGESSAGAAGSSRRKWRSMVWEYFNRKNKKEVYCNICRMTIKGTNTTNMMAHLKDCHQVFGRFKGSTSNNASWNSTYMMLQTIVEGRDALEAEAKKSGSGILQPRQFATIGGLLQILKLLSQATKTIAGELPTEPFQSGISTVIPMVFVLEKQLESMTEKLPVDKAVKAFLKAIQHQLDQRFGKLPDFYYAATLLDPRYKDTCFDKNIALRWISTNLNTQMSETSQNLSATFNSTSKTSNSDEDLWDLWDKCVRKTSTEDIGQWKDEFDSYMGDESLDRRSDPLIWWKNQSDKYPILCGLATKIISIPATSLAYDSLARLVVADLRTGITDENFEKCLFVKLNYQLLVDYVLDDKQKKIAESLHL